jgi:hypothetical protein
MNFEKVVWETIVAYFIIAATVVWAIWKSLPPFLVWLDNRQKNRREQIKLDRSESADFRKAELEHEIKLEELVDKKVQAYIERQENEIERLEGDNLLLEEEIKKFKQANDERKLLMIKKVFMLRESQRELQMLEAIVLKLEDKDEFQTEVLKIIDSLKTKTQEHEKLLS